MKTHTYCSELDEWILNWRIDCGHVIRQYAGIRAVWHSRSILRFDDIVDIFHNDERVFGEKKKNMSRKSSSTWRPASKGSGSSRPRRTQTSQIQLKQLSVSPIQYASSRDRQMISVVIRICIVIWTTFRVQRFYFVHFDLRAFIGKHKCVIDTHDFSMVGSQN